MKKALALLLALLCLPALSACSGGNTSESGEISVFYYTFSDTYVSGVRSELDRLFEEKGLVRNNYDANGNQTTQTEQIHTALAKGSRLLIVNVVDTGSDDAAQNILSLAAERNVPVIFFNRSVSDSVTASYAQSVFVGTNYEMAGHLQGGLIGDYVLANYDALDLNGDGRISYVLFKGQEGNLEAIARTRYAVEDCNAILEAAGKPPLVFYDASNPNGYLVDQNGTWSSQAAAEYMSTLLARYSEASGNMVELVIANNDEMALGALSGLQNVGYNNGQGKNIPIFGIDATEAAKAAIAAGTLTGTVRQDAAGMAKSILTIADNYLNGRPALSDLKDVQTVGDKRVNIPYTVYTQDAYGTQG